MSVLSHNRTLSNMEFYKVSVDITKEAMILINRQLGIRKKVYSLEILNKNGTITKEEEDKINSLLKEMGISKCEAKILRTTPMFILKKDHKDIKKYSDKIRQYVVCGNETFPHNVYEYILREIYLHKAKTNCILLNNKLLSMVETYNISVNPISNIIELLRTEISLIEGVIKRDKSRFTNFEDDAKNVTLLKSLDDSGMILNDILHEIK